MAATITDIGSGTSIAAPTSITTGATITATTSNNDWLVVLVVWAKGADASTGCTDSAGNTYTERVNAGFVGSTSGVRLAIYTAPVTVNITNGTITATYSTTSPQCAIQVYRVRPSSGTVSFVAADTVGVGAENTSHTAATISVTNGNTIFGVAGVETDDSITGDSDTANGSWSTVATLLADSGTDVNAQTLISQYKTVTATGNQSWNCSTVAARAGLASYLVLKAQTVALSLAADLGQYTLSGTAVTMRIGLPAMVAGAGSYAMTGTAATLRLAHSIVASAGSYTLLGTDASTLHGWRVTAGVDSYALTGTSATPIASSSKRIQPDSGSYALTGTDASLTLAHAVTAGVGSYALTGTTSSTLHAWVITAGSSTLDELLLETGDSLLAEDSSPLLLGETSGDVDAAYTLIGTDAGLVLSTAANKVIIAGSGSYVLTGTDATLTLAIVPKTLVAESGSYLLTGTEVTLRSSAQPVVSPLHIGEWPIDKRRRRRREDASAVEQRARKRFRDAIGRLLEGLPPEFDEPADLDEALDSAVQASNLLYALSAPIREINAVNELIDHIRQLRIAQPIAQLHLAQAYNQAHRHLTAKAQEDTVMALLLGD